MVSEDPPCPQPGLFMGSVVLPFWNLLLKGKLAERCVKAVLRALQLLGGGGMLCLYITI